jgi:nucleotide-binding universal stress UspA family protein
MNHKRILVALSLTHGPDPAFERALALAKASGAEPYLLHAVPANRPFSFRAAERLRRSMKLRERAEAVGVKVQRAEQHGDPAEIIVLHADVRPVDLIVMSTERRTGWARFRQPSVAERVLRRTKRPTLVVPSDDTVDGSAFENVLVAVDLSPASMALIDRARQLFGRDARQLTVIHAIDSIEAPGAVRNRARWMVPEYRGYVLDDARRQLEAVMPPSLATDIRPQLRVAAGSAAKTIGVHAADVNADVIVMGRSRRFMHLGSTAVRILRNTDRALLVVPPLAAPMIDAGQSIHKRAASPAQGGIDYATSIFLFRQLTKRGILSRTPRGEYIRSSASGAEALQSGDAGVRTTSTPPRVGW